MPSKIIPRRPGIYQIGRIEKVNGQTWIRGWGLTLCSRQCKCHLNGAGQISIFQNETVGLLGLVSFQSGCECCVPWTSTELLGILHDLKMIEEIGAQD